MLCVCLQSKRNTSVISLMLDVGYLWYGIPESFLYIVLGQSSASCFLFLAELLCLSTDKGNSLELVLFQSP